jgi:hypothetical protein
MSTATLSDRIMAADAVAVLKPLDFAEANGNAPQFIGKVANAIANAWVQATCLDGVIYKHDDKADLGAMNGEGATLEELVDIRNRAVAS